MAEDAAERRMERSLFGVSPPTPTASSAGPTLTVQGNYASIDWHGLAQKKPAISGTSAGPPRPAVSTSTAAVSGSSSHRHLCRPWDCGDLLRRLSTFKISHWNNQVIGPAGCARKGWVNVDADMIACEGCDTHLSFAIPPQIEVEAASESFRKQLETCHQASCPWKGNACSESLAQFPSSVMPLIGGYNDRCDALLQLLNLPVVSATAVDHMKLSRAPQMERLLALPLTQFPGRNGAGASSDDFVKAQRIISFCGWEARFLPHAGELEDYSAHSSRNPNKASVPLKRGKRKAMPRSDKEGESRGVRPTATTLLECVYCGANVTILRFQTVSRPGAGVTISENPTSENKNPLVTRGASAASSMDIHKRRQREASEAAEHKPPPSLSATAVRGPSRIATTSAPVRSEQQPEGSEMGDCGAASYESRGPRDDLHATAGQGDSSTYMPQLRAESAGGTTGDFDVEDEGKSAAESSKRKRAPESLAADQHSLGMAGSGNAAASEQEADTDDRKNKRVCIGPEPASAVERTVSIEVPDNRNARSLPIRQENLRRRVTREYPCSSSVNAIDTCFQNKMEDSLDSVEFAPADDAQQHTAASGYTENEWLFDEPNSTAQAQQSNSYAPANVQGATTGEKSYTNAAVISTGTGTAGGGSVGMGGIGPGTQRVQSNEADIQGADFSELQTESVAGEAAEAVIDAVVDQRDPGLVCDSTPLTVAQDGTAGDESGESGSKASLRPHNGSSTMDTTNAVIRGCSVGTIAKEVTEGSVEAGAVGDNDRAATTSAPTAKDAEEAHFDPIRCHRSFCPWVNGLVLSAANGIFGLGPDFCGWQLTVDALDAFHQQENASAGVTESESTASMCKDDGPRRIFAQGSSSQHCNGSSRL